MKSLLGLALLLLMPFICLAEEETRVLDNNYHIQYRVKDGKVYDNDYTIKYRIKDGNIYDSHYGKVGSYKGPHSIPSGKGGRK
jgi:hypothetical protein